MLWYLQLVEQIQRWEESAFFEDTAQKKRRKGTLIEPCPKNDGDNVSLPGWVEVCMVVGVCENKCGGGCKAG